MDFVIEVFDPIARIFPSVGAVSFGKIAAENMLIIDPQAEECSKEKTSSLREK